MEDLLQTIPLEERKLVAGDLIGNVVQRAPNDSVIQGNFGYGTNNYQGLDIMNVATQIDLPIVNTYFQKENEPDIRFFFSEICVFFFLKKIFTNVVARLHI